MILQLRDILLLENLKKFGVLSTPQIQRLHFVGIAKETALRRLRALEAGHFIRRAVPLEDATNTWTLAFKGKHQQAIEDRLQFSNRNTIRHDIIVNDVRMKLESFGLASEWTPEYQIKAETFRNYRYKHAKERVIPDGLMIELMSGKPQRIAIEVELTRKSEARYKRIFREYKDLRYDIIWYFVNDTKDLFKIYQAAERTFGFDEGNLFFSITSNFLKEPIPDIYPIQEPEWMPLTRILFDHLTISSPAHTPAQGVSRQNDPGEQLEATPKPSDLQPNSLFPAPLRGGFSTPDPSPPTSGGKGSGVENREGDGMRAFSVSSELKKCG
ncbi:replication-relaxation family protein [Bdellovibrio svalbardensis]|uniref:Replication-relaxation family protein n=1 Tax=Bdellovibrio svalbardensis TaxID=2972972 RepID=A0ABT6DK07_9BACT|nr:replication-relaxation family protein [Bdellovibrio svalbardensis]MDG0817185.1 replication-relaxation family protein [Bdellovibrio svalbardensis]